MWIRKIFQERKKHEDGLEKTDNEEMRNGCCKECMKAFSSKGKVDNENKLNL